MAPMLGEFEGLRWLTARGTQLLGPIVNILLRSWLVRNNLLFLFDFDIVLLFEYLFYSHVRARSAVPVRVSDVDRGIRHVRVMRDSFVLSVESRCVWVGRILKSSELERAHDCLALIQIEYE